MIKIVETDHRFAIADSTMPGAGLGLYATEVIKTGDYLEIIGVVVDVGDVANRCTHYADRYKFANETESKIQNAIIPMGYAAMINHADTPEKQNVAITYIPDNHPRRNPACANVVYLATRDIMAGEELLTNYQRKDTGLASEPMDLKHWKQLLASNFYGLACLLDAKVYVPEKKVMEL